jgi:hypothetical protein
MADAVGKVDEPEARPGAMTERDTEIEFDFFEEPATREATRPDRLPRRARGPRRPPSPPSGLTPLLRLVGLISFAILVVVLLVFWVSSCRGEAKRDRYQGYMGDVQQVADRSERIGSQLATTMTRPRPSRSSPHSIRIREHVATPARVGDDRKSGRQVEERAIPTARIRRSSPAPSHITRLPGGSANVALLGYWRLGRAGGPPGRARARLRVTTPATQRDA